MDMIPENAMNAGEELRKRRSSRIVQAVPLMVKGVDALGRPFVERTSSLIINCHGARYQSKHYVLKNMWVKLEIPHPESGQAPRTVRGRVAWIQRPRTVRQLFQVALELEIPGNVWGIAFPPEDWFVFSDVAQACTKTDPAQEAPPPVVPTSETEIVMPLEEPDTPPKTSADNVRVFPSPASTTDASLQLARQVARLVADAKQQIQAATREAASQAVSAERRLSFEQWEQKFAAGRTEIANEATRAIERLHEEADEQSRTTHAAAAEALRNELPRWLAPQLEQLTHELTSRLSQEGVAQRNEHAQQLEQMAGTLRTLCHQGEETAAKLKAEAEQSQAQLTARAEEAARTVEEAAKQREETAAMRRDALKSAAIEIEQRVDAAKRSIGEAASQQEQTVTSQRDALSSAANEIRQHVESAIAAAQSSWQGQLSNEVEAAQVRWRAAIEGTLAEAQDRAAGALNEQARGLFATLQEEMARHATAVRESAAGTKLEAEQRMAALREALQEQSQRLETALRRARESSERIENHTEQLEDVKQRALAGFQAQLDDVLNLHRNELHRRSGSLIDEINERIRTTFEESTRQALATFDRQVEELVQPHVSRTEEAIHRLAGGRSLLDAALTLQQDRIRNSADEAFAESLGRFRENLGGVEQIL